MSIFKNFVIDKYFAAAMIENEEGEKAEKT